MVSVYGRNLFYFYKSLKEFDAECTDRYNLDHSGTDWWFNSHNTFIRLLITCKLLIDEK